MFEKDISGEIIQAAKRYTKANNKQMEDQYNPDKKAHIFNTQMQAISKGG